ncbi:hypothetical protein [Paraburkholderia elongata]|uniref:Uncharacterized protein n=1 Tax=Paraburkholderia elongata TaxID=2675747 RepID=A0A972NM64_9BURK|nr:hypothetical protein [Paraburkholderia elongata]NPT54833.1 hypothetical protein [Paraburkholderia elongata]
MPQRTDRPKGMRARRDRNGAVTYYLLREDGSKLVLGQNFELACAQWVHEQQSRVALARPATALELLHGIEQCTLPLASRQATARRRSEMDTLRGFFTEHGDPKLEEITGEDVFLRWYGNTVRPGRPDSAIRMFRLVWKSASKLGIVSTGCPWNTFDLRKAQLKMEAADVVRHFASAPLSELLEDLMGRTAVTTVEFPGAVESDYVERLRVELSHAASRAVMMLRKSGRTDLVAPVYQLEINDLLSLRRSTCLALIRPPGSILLQHQRAEILASLKTKTKCSDDTADVGTYLAQGPRDQENEPMPVLTQKDSLEATTWPTD